MSMNGMNATSYDLQTDTLGLTPLDRKLDRIDHKLNLLFTALENVRVLSPVRDESGDVIGLNAVVAPPMVETGIK